MLRGLVFGWYTPLGAGPSESGSPPDVGLTPWFCGNTGEGTKFLIMSLWSEDGSKQACDVCFLRLCCGAFKSKITSPSAMGKLGWTEEKLSTWWAVWTDKTAVLTQALSHIPLCLLTLQRWGAKLLQHSLTLLPAFGGKRDWLPKPDSVRWNERGLLVSFFFHWAAAPDD